MWEYREWAEACWNTPKSTGNSERHGKSQEAQNDMGKHREIRKAEKNTGNQRRNQKNTRETHWDDMGIAQERGKTLEYWKYRKYWELAKYGNNVNCKENMAMG